MRSLPTSGRRYVPGSFIDEDSQYRRCSSIVGVWSSYFWTFPTNAVLQPRTVRYFHRARKYELHTFREHPKHPAVVVRHNEIRAILRLTDVVELQGIQGSRRGASKGSTNLPPNTFVVFQANTSAFIEKWKLYGRVSQPSLYIEEPVSLPPCRQKSIASRLG